MKPTTKEKWVIDRLIKDGYKILNPGYCDTKETFFKMIRAYEGFDCTDSLIVTVDRNWGIYFDSVRPRRHPEIHIKLHLPWLGKNNWHLLHEGEETIKKLVELVNQS